VLLGGMKGGWEKGKKRRGKALHFETVIGGGGV
jgi:hypothetical protein